MDDQFLCPSDSSGGTAPSIGSQCDPGAAWGAGEILEVEASGLDYLVAITPDELSLVWFVAGGSAGAYFIADRAAVDAAFEPPVLIPGPVVTLSPDGLRLVTLSPDGAFLERSRAARGEAFGDAEEGSFALLNAAALANGHTFQECVVSPDDQSLYYNVYGDDADLYPLRVSQRTGSEPWAIGEPIEACELKALGSLARRPTAISADGLTLFFFDPARDVARAAFRRTVDGPFIHFADLGDRRQAQPNQACDRLYYSANDGSSGLFAATAQ